jgi:hypothetical protein
MSAALPRTPRASQLAKVAKAAAEVAAAEAVLAAKREALIARMAAASERGASYRAIAAAASLSSARVGQLLGSFARVGPAE